MLSVADPDSGVDVLHVAFGGLGGHAPVVTTLTKQLSLAGIRSGVITYAERTALEANTGAWSDVQVIHPIELKGRLDLVAWRRIFRIVRDLKPRVVILHTLKLAVPTKVALQSMRRTSSTCLLIEHQAIDLRSISYNALSALALPFVGNPTTWVTLTVAALAMGMMIFYTNVTARGLHYLASRGLLRRTQAWRAR